MKFINRKLNWEMLWIDACSRYTKIYMRRNKKLSNLRVHFSVKAVVNFCVKSKDSVVLGLSGQISQVCKDGRNSEGLWRSAKVLP